jgi:hypothetical protein
MFVLPISCIVAILCPTGCATPLVVCILCSFVFLIIRTFIKYINSEFEAVLCIYIQINLRVLVNKQNSAHWMLEF